MRPGLLATCLALLLPRAAVAGPPLLDLYAHGLAGAGVFTPLGFHPGLLRRGGLAVEAWVARRVALGLDVGYGSYYDLAVPMGFASLRYALDEQRSIALGLGTNLITVYLLYSPYPGWVPPPQEWDELAPILALSASWEPGRRALFSSLGLRAEASRKHLGLALEGGFGLRLRRR